MKIGKGSLGGGYLFVRSPHRARVVCRFVLDFRSANNCCGVFISRPLSMKLCTQGCIAVLFATREKEKIF